MCVCVCIKLLNFPGGWVESACNGGDVGDKDSTPGLGRVPGGGHSHLFQYSCLKNPKGRGAWQAKVYRVSKSRTLLK